MRSLAIHGASKQQIQHLNAAQSTSNSRLTAFTTYVSLEARYSALVTDQWLDISNQDDSFLQYASEHKPPWFTASKTLNQSFVHCAAWYMGNAVVCEPLSLWTLPGDCSALVLAVDFPSMHKCHTKNKRMPIRSTGLPSTAQQQQASKCRWTIAWGENPREKLTQPQPDQHWPTGPSMSWRAGQLVWLPAPLLVKCRWDLFPPGPARWFPRVWTAGVPCTMQW